MATSYNNMIPDPLNLRNKYNPAPFDRTHVFNVHYLIDLGKRYREDHRLLAEAANGWQISGISTFQSGVVHERIADCGPDAQPGDAGCEWKGDIQYAEPDRENLHFDRGL